MEILVRKQRRLERHKKKRYREEKEKKKFVFAYNKFFFSTV